MSGESGEDTLQLVGDGPISLSGFIAANSSIEVLVTNGLAINGKPGANKFDFRGVEVQGTLVVNGGGGADRIIGSDFDDDLRGGSARDFLTSGKRDDRLSRGRHGDVFVFGEECGDDAITDFRDLPNDQDIIKLVGFGEVLAADFDDWKNEHVGTDSEGNVLITLGLNTITLSGFKDVGKLGFDDFLFV